MSLRFPCACPRAKQIFGAKKWLGFAGGFNFPGFKANYSTVECAWTYAVSGAGDSGTFTYTCTGSAPNFAVGDLVLQEFPAATATDYLTGITQTYPKYFWVYNCIAAINGSALAPSNDPEHFIRWTFGTYGGSDAGGPSGWPGGLVNGLYASVGSRYLNSQTTDTAQLEVTTTTTLNNFPLFPATISGLKALLPSSGNDTAATFDDPNSPYLAANGTFTSQWQFPNTYDGATPAYTAPTTAPTTQQAYFIFPIVPVLPIFTFSPDPSYADLQQIYALETPNDGPALVSWSFSATSITFEFAVWYLNTYLSYGLPPGYETCASAPATVTQTITLGGASYSKSDASTQAAALMAATTFDSIAWNTSWSNAWDTSGNLVTTQNIPGQYGTFIPEAGGVGTPVQFGVALNDSLTFEGVTTCYMTQALVDICGNYCLRTYAEGTTGPTSCSNGNVNGFAPFTLSPPATPGQSVAAYNQGRC